jgi:Flp pilus assembly protein TadB
VLIKRKILKEIGISETERARVDIGPPGKNKKKINFYLVCFFILFLISWVVVILHLFLIIIILLYIMCCEGIMKRNELRRIFYHLIWSL